MSCLSPSETSSTKDLSISSRNLLSPSMRITLLKCGSQCCKTAIDSGRHRCSRGAQDLSHLRKRQVFLKPQQQSLAIQRWQNLQPARRIASSLRAAASNGEGSEEGNSSTASRSFGKDTVATAFRFFRRLSIAKLRAIANSHGSNRCRPLYWPPRCSTRIQVSCARSSAYSRLPVRYSR